MKVRTLRGAAMGLVAGLPIPFGAVRFFVFDLWSLQSFAFRPLRGGIYGALRACMLLWLVGQVLSDAVRDSPVNETVLGAGYIVLLWIGAEALGGALATGRVTEGEVALLSAGAVLGFNIVDRSLFDLQPWKFGLGYFVAVVGWTALAERRRLQLAFGAALAFFSLLVGSRSLALTIVMSLVILAFAGGGRPRRRRLRVGPVRLALLAAVGASLVAVAYGTLATSGALGETGKSQYEMQSEGRLWIAGGRQDFIVSTALWLESPLVGYGSRPDLPESFEVGSTLDSLGYHRLADRLAATGADQRFPLHSQVLGALSQAGVLAIPFWLSVIVVLARGVKASVGSSLGIVLCFTLISALGGVLFSPPRSFTRITVAAAIALAVHLIEPRLDTARVGKRARR